MRRCQRNEFEKGLFVSHRVSIAAAYRSEHYCCRKQRPQIQPSVPREQDHSYFITRWLHRHYWHRCVRMLPSHEPFAPAALLYRWPCPSLDALLDLLAFAFTLPVPVFRSSFAPQKQIARCFEVKPCCVQWVSFAGVLGEANLKNSLKEVVLGFLAVNGTCFLFACAIGMRKRFRFTYTVHVLGCLERSC